MIRKFKFEDEMHESLQCVPMAVRRKLDRVGLKIGLEQWKSLDRGERLAICHLPVDSSEECDALGVFIREAMKRRFGVEPKSLTDAQRASAEPPAAPPDRVVSHARAAGFDLSRRGLVATRRRRAIRSAQDGRRGEAKPQPRRCAERIRSAGDRGD